MTRFSFGKYTPVWRLPGCFLYWIRDGMPRGISRYGDGVVFIVQINLTEPRAPDIDEGRGFNPASPSVTFHPRPWLVQRPWADIQYTYNAGPFADNPGHSASLSQMRHVNCKSAANTSQNCVMPQPSRHPLVLSASTSAVVSCPSGAMSRLSTA